MSSRNDEEDQAFESVLSRLDAQFKESLSQQEQLQLYGWFKVAQTLKQQVTSPPPPSGFSITAQAKYKAYQSVSHLSKSEAILQYIGFVKSKATDLSLEEIIQACDAALLKLQNGNDEVYDTCSPSPSSEDVLISEQTEQDAARVPSTPPARLFSLSQFIPRPMVPRGQLDTTLLELLYALVCCVWSPKVGNCQLSLLRENEDDTSPSLLFGLSVRSLLDLYLSTKQFPKGSEIIISPAISIKGMLEIIQQQHGLNIVAVDLPDETTIAVNIPAIREKINSKTVAILLVNAFGNDCASASQRRELFALAQSSNIEILEDAAESYNGALPDTDHAHVSFVSFGLIKTSTAVAGGVVVIRDEDLAKQMCRRQESYPIQSRWEYARRVIKAMVLHGILSSGYIYGFLHDAISMVWDFDAVVYHCQRGFPSSATMADIRKRPSSPLLEVLHRCVRTEMTKTVVARRIVWADTMDNQELHTRPKFPSRCTHWLYPILATTSSDAKNSCRLHRQEHRVDATKGTLIAVDNTVPLTNRLMDRLFYLPVNLPPDRLRSGPQRLSRKCECAILLCFVVLLWYFRRMWLFLFKLALCSACAGILLGWFLQRFAGKHYVQSSSAFAEFSFLFDQSERSSKRPSLDIISKIPELALPSHGNRRRSVILTGCTGFVGSMVLRDLLAHRIELQIDRIILFCRSKRGKSASERVESVVDTQMFSFVGLAERNGLLEVIDIDLTQDLTHLVKSNDENCFRNVTHVFHCAAAVSFTQSLREAAISNISATLNLQQLASMLGRNVKFVHVSTAFIRGKRAADFLHDEKLCPFGSFDPLAIYNSMLGSQYHASKAMHELGFVNTYTFSKSVCEHLLVRYNPGVIIIRPSIVGPAVETPYEGWYGCFPSTLIAAACLFFRFQWNVWSFGPYHVPCIPVDVLSRLIIAKALQDYIDGDCSVETTDETDSFDKVSELSLDSSEHQTESSAEILSLTKGTIINATWDHRSHATSQFLWSDYAAAVAQTGSVLNHFSRIRGAVALFVATILIPKLALSDRQFTRLHSAVVMGPIDVIARISSKLGLSLELDRIRTLSMLPLLFAPFTRSNYKFQSCLLAPEEYCGRRYLASCVAAADEFITKQTSTHFMGTRHLRFHTFAGRDAATGGSNMWWALTQPRGGILCRVMAFLLLFVLRFCFTTVSVDLLSFASICKCKDADRIILTPTHRSFFDFLLLYFLCFSIPELQLGWPFAAAATDFDDIPLVGVVMQALGAFFVQRGRSCADPMLSEKIPRKPGACPKYLVFIEGTRSRDRRFGKPKTGVLRCLHDKGKTVVVPIGISYEKIAEQQAFDDKVGGIIKSSMSLKGLLCWIWDVGYGRVSLGQVHIKAVEPFIVDGNDVGWAAVASNIQSKQTEAIHISNYHVYAMSSLLGIHHTTVRESLQQLGARWFRSNTTLTIPTSKSECLSIAMQASFLLEPLLRSHDLFWSQWLHSHINKDMGAFAVTNGPVKELSDKLRSLFHAADSLVNQAIKTLATKGTTNPIVEHIVQLALLQKTDVPAVLLNEVAQRYTKVSKEVSVGCNSTYTGLCINRQDRALFGFEDLGFWGYRDSRFIVCQNGSDVMLEGERYSLSGKPLPGLLSFISEETRVQIDLDNEAFTETKDEIYPLCRLTQVEIDELSEFCEKISTKTKERLRHGSGHSLGDVLASRQSKPIRIPDCVVWPNSESDVNGVVSLARDRGWCIIPFGGGTNVSQATRCPLLEVEPRPIISLDTKLLCKLLWIDEVNRLAEVEAGVTGKQLEEELNKKGYTMGHEPDSLEFSTLGGWIATKASGMKRNKYGNIEDIVVAVSIASADGALKRDFHGRESCGLVLKDLFLGSEGCLGIVTSAQIKIFQLPDVKQYECALLKNFSCGVQLAQMLIRQRCILPASIRLLDNAHFRLGQALRPGNDFSLSRELGRLVQTILLRRENFQTNEVAIVCFVFEGTKDEVTLQKASVFSVLNLFAHCLLGKHFGKSCYDMTYTIAYLRDFALTYWYLGESLECSVPWTRTSELVEGVKQRIIDEHALMLLPGRPFVGYRITQLYHEGVCVYIYICMSFRGVDEPEKSFALLEKAARDEILARGGSISHHHGVGKIRIPFLQQVDGQGSLSISRKVKQALDPLNIFAARNGRYYDEDPTSP